MDINKIVTCPGMSHGNENKVICEEMCFYCFDHLIKILNNSKKDIIPRFPNNSYPLFVTWMIGKDLDLRGCIGIFSSIQIHKGLAEYAVISSMKDTRFSPISQSELKELHCGVSLLTNFENADNYLDWQIGKHGIRINFLSHSATYLPEVASEQGWTKEEALDSLIRKSGYHGIIDQKLLNSISLERYQSEKLTVSYTDYLKARK